MKHLTIVNLCELLRLGSKSLRVLRLQKQDERGSSSEPKSYGGQVLPFKAVGSGAPAFVPPSLRKDDNAYEVRMPDLPFL